MTSMIVISLVYLVMRMGSHFETIPFTRNLLEFFKDSWGGSSGGAEYLKLCLDSKND